MKFLIPKNTITNNYDRYSFRTRGKLILDHLDKRHGICHTIDDLNEKDLFIIGKGIKSYPTQELIMTLCKNNIKFVIDISDYKFNKQEWFYIWNILSPRALAITTTCKKLAEEASSILKRECYVIPDATERKESKHNVRFIKDDDLLKCVWYGSSKNLRMIDTKKLITRMKNVHKNVEMKYITDKKLNDPVEWVSWTYEVQEKLVKESDIVIIPTEIINKDVLCKGNNRPVDGIRQGKFVITSDVIPSYQELKDFLFLGEVEDGINYFKNNTDSVINKIEKGQDFIRKNYEPNIIANTWLALEKHLLKTR